MPARRAALTAREQERVARERERAALEAERAALEAEKDERRRAQLRAAQSRFRDRERNGANSLRDRSSLQAEAILQQRMEIEALRERLSCHEEDAVVPRALLPDPAWLAPPPPPKPKRQCRKKGANKNSEPSEDSSSDAGDAVGAAPDQRPAQEASCLATWHPHPDGNQEGQWIDINEWRDAMLNQPSAPSFGAFAQPGVPQRRESWQPLPGNYDGHLSRPGFERNGTSVPNLHLGPPFFHTPELLQSAQLSAATTPTWTSSGSERRDERNMTDRHTPLGLALRAAAAETGGTRAASSQKRSARSKRRNRAATTVSAPAPIAPTTGTPMRSNDRPAFRTASMGSWSMMANHAGQGINAANGAGPSSQPYYANINEANGTGPSYQSTYGSINEANEAGPSNHSFTAFPSFQWNCPPVPGTSMPAQEESVPPLALPASNVSYGLVAAADDLDSTLTSMPAPDDALMSTQLAHMTEQEQDRQTEAVLAEALSYDAAAFASKCLQPPDSF